MGDVTDGADVDGGLATDLQVCRMMFVYCNRVFYLAGFLKERQKHFMRVET